MYVNKIEVQMRLKQMGKTQAELAKAIGITEKALSRMLHIGKTKDTIAIAMAKSLDVELSKIARLDLADSEINHLISMQENYFT